MSDGLRPADPMVVMAAAEILKGMGWEAGVAISAEGVTILVRLGVEKYAEFTAPEGLSAETIAASVCARLALIN